MLPLEAYDMSGPRGYLCRHNADEVTLGGALGEAAKTAQRLPQILLSGHVRDILMSWLPQSGITEEIDGLTDMQTRMAMVYYSFMVQAYVWGEDSPPHILPACLAQPMTALADKLGQQPLMPYSSYVLDNWGLIDKSKPIDLDNIYMLQNFLGGQDEAWFVLVHVAIEARAGAMLEKMGPLITAAAQQDIDAARQYLEGMAVVWADLKAIFDRMPERCDPYIYFQRVRPYIHGWKDNPALPNGIIYEGVERYGSKGQAFRGQTGSQSSIVPAMDALLGVGHADDPLKDFLDQLHIYRPPAHRQFIDDVRRESGVRDFVSTSHHKGLITAYNANIQAVADFRSRHLEYAASYINKQGKTADGNDNEVGTGGTPFMRYLKKHRDETQARLIHI